MASDLAGSLGIQSWCFRGFKSHEGVIKALKDCGVSRLELSGAHYDPAKETNHREIIDLYKKGGITISAYGVCLMSTDEARSRAYFEFAKAAGNKVLNVAFGEGGREMADRLAKEYGIKAALHNHGRKDEDGPVWRIEEHFAKSSPNIGLCLDTAWMMDSGEDPIAIAKKFRDRIYAVHVKDFVFERNGKPEDVVVGEGNLDLKALLAFLVDINFGGVFTLEFEGDINDPVPATTKCVEAVRRTLAAL
jgi:inosose dehydratase